MVKRIVDLFCMESQRVEGSAYGVHQFMISANDNAFSTTPKYTDSNGSRSINYRGWTLRTNKKPILNAGELQVANAALPIPLPEMTFGHNNMRVECGTFSYEFNCLDALATVDASPAAGDRIKVAMSNKWTEKSKEYNQEITNVIKPYDWTYTTDYVGTSTSTFTPSETNVDMELLQRPDPILFYEHCVLFEDELGDNGAALLDVRVRVMPTFFLILQRFFLRVDGVLLRTYDTRIMHEFGTDKVVRYICNREGAYEHLSNVY